MAKIKPANVYGYVDQKKWIDIANYYQEQYNLSVLDTMVESSAIKEIANKYGIGANKSFRIGEFFSKNPKTLFDFWTMGEDSPLCIMGMMNETPFSYTIDNPVKMIEKTINKFLSLSFGATFSEIGHMTHILLSMWRDEEFMTMFDELIREVERIFPKDSILVLKKSGSPLYIEHKYMVSNINVLSSIPVDKINDEIECRLIDRLTNEHIKNLIYTGSKKMVVYAIEKFQEDDARLRVDDTYSDAIVEY